MGQNNDTTEHGDLQGNQGAPKGTPKSEYLKMPDREGNNPFRGETVGTPGRGFRQTEFRIRLL